MVTRKGKTELNPQLIGELCSYIAAGNYAVTACSLCGACGEVCPVEIPLPRLINRLRAEAVAAQRDDHRLQGRGSLRRPAEALAWKSWRTLYSRPVLYRLFTHLATRLPPAAAPSLESSATVPRAKRTEGTRTAASPHPTSFIQKWRSR